jgi:hypothetical protein
MLIAMPSPMSHAAAPPRGQPAAGLRQDNPHQAPAPGTQVRIEASLQLVVLEFREPDGAVRQSIPTPRELDAYRHPPLPANGPAAGPAPGPALELRA